jgi:2-polyprenyl-3-methyl-5-hydroxy-6-metoxy-1,4-benzoquinol methylase
MDAIAQFKEVQKAMWAGFGVLESITGTAAPRLVRFAGIGKDSEVLDVACGSGVVALTSARLGARVTGADLTPELVARARQNAALMKLEVSWLEADAEALPLPDAKFDYVRGESVRTHVRAAPGRRDRRNAASTEARRHHRLRHLAAGAVHRP